MEQKRIRDYGIIPGNMQTGPLNRITDVPGVKVGQVTIHEGNNHTGLTVIVPGEDNAFVRKYTAAAYVHNGFGKSAGLLQVQELGSLETPIALTNTMNVGLVWDGLLEYVLRRCESEGIPCRSVNPVVGECNDSQINQIQVRKVRPEDVGKAIESASEIFSEGDAGAGTGTICYGFKGGIGSSSRLIQIGKKTFTLGVLVQSNFGAMRDFVLDGKKVGKEAAEQLRRRKETGKSELDRGSIMSVLATDLPLSSRQLYRVIRRLGVGIARTGSYTGHGSGEFMIGFTTANRISGDEDLQTQTVLKEGLLDRAFAAAAEAENEAILNSMVCAHETRGLQGEIYPSLADWLNVNSVNGDGSF